MPFTTYRNWEYPLKGTKPYYIEITGLYDQIDLDVNTLYTRIDNLTIDNLAPGGTKGDIFIHDGSSYTRVSVGPDGYFLGANSAHSTGVSWTAVQAGQIAKVLSYRDNQLAPPTSPSLGDRYILDWSGTTNTGWTSVGAASGDIVEWDGLVWGPTEPVDGWRVFVDDENQDRQYVDNPSPDWEERPAATNHWSRDTVNGYVIPAVATDYVQADGLLLKNTSTPSHLNKLIFWDSDHNCPAFMNDRAAPILQIGRELWVRCYNNSGVTINAGDLVYATGWSNHDPTIAKANNTIQDQVEALLGMATETILNGERGELTSFGGVHDLNTLGETSGVPVYLGLNGAWTTTKPLSPAFAHRVGTMGRISATGGIIFMGYGSDLAAAGVYWTRTGTILSPLTVGDGLAINSTGIAADDIKLLTAGGIDIDAATVMTLDSADDSNVTMTADSAGLKQLQIRAANAGAGTGWLNLTGDDGVWFQDFAGQDSITLDYSAGSIAISGSTLVDIDAGTGGVTIDCAATGDIALTAANHTNSDILFAAHNSGAIPFNTAAGPTLVGFIATDIIGSLNELKAAASVSPLTTKGDIYTYAATNARLAVGSNGQVLSADSTQATGLKWIAAVGTGDVSAAAVIADHTVVRGDGGAKGVQDSGISIDDSDNISGIGNITLSGTVDGIDIAVDVAANTLKVTNATHSGEVTGSGVLTITADAVTYAKMQNVVSNNVLLGNISGAGSAVAEITATQIRSLINVENGADVTDASNVATAGAVMASLADAKGDIFVATADNTVTRLALGTDGHVLTVDSAEATGVKWASSVLAMDDLSDVSTFGATQGEVLAYNESSGTWAPLTIGSSLQDAYDGGSTVSMVTGAADIQFNNGLDYMRLTHEGTDLLDLDIQVRDFDLTASEAAGNAINLIASSGGISMNSSSTNTFVVNGTPLGGTSGIVANCTYGNIQLISSNNITFDAGTSGISVDTTGPLTMDGVALSIDSTDTTNLTMSANASGSKTMSIIATNSHFTGAANLSIQGQDVLILSDDSSQDTVTLTHALGSVSITGSTVVDINSGSSGITLDAPGPISIDSTYNNAAAINITTNAGTAEVISIINSQGNTDGALTLTATAGGIDFNASTNITFDASSGYCLLTSSGNARLWTTGGVATLKSGKTGAGAVSIEATGATGGIDMDAVGVIEINSSAGVIGIGNDAVAQNINIGTGAAARTITIGNATGATNLALTAGTGGIDLTANGSTTQFNDSVDAALYAKFATSSVMGAINENSITWHTATVSSASHSVGTDEVVILVSYTATGVVTVTIPSAVIAVIGRIIVVKDIGLNASVNNITVETGGSETIEGQANAVLDDDGQSLTFFSDGSNLHII